MTALGLSILLPFAVQVAPADEETYYTLEHLPSPEGLEVGGLGFLSDGRLAVSTRRGQVWIVEGALADDPAAARFHLFAEGLQEGLGLAVADDELFVLQRGELSRLVDEDGDGTCDRVDTVANDWGLSGNYHEFAFGLPRDEEGNFYAALNVGFFDPKWWSGRSTAPWRGWALRIAPDGEVTPVASGFRSPCGLGRSPGGDIFVTDNQGDWVASSPIYHLVDGRFYGHPASLDWTSEYRESNTLASDEVPPARASERAPAAVWIPYKWSRSTGDLAADTSGGAFGPFGGQLFVAELTNGLVLRTVLEKVRGEYQGACFLFRQGIGSVVRVAFAPDGTLFCGLTNRGWGGLPPSEGLARVRWTGETPMEMHDVRLLQDGFEIRFTKPVAAGTEILPERAHLVSYDYDYWWEYGSPERDLRQLPVASTDLSADRRTLTVRTDALEPARVVRLALEGVVAEDGSALLHDEFAYTINQLPEGPLTRRHVAKIVPPPPSRATQEEGWLRLTYGDALELWESEGWALRDVEWSPESPETLVTGEGTGALVNLESRAPSHFVSRAGFGDCELSLYFMLPEDGNSGVYLMGRYEVQLRDSSGIREPGFGDCGGLYRGEHWPGSAPTLNAFRGPGQWHRLSVDFRAPRFDAEGRKSENARFVSVAIDGVPVQTDVEVPEPTRGPLADHEVPRGPILLQGDHGPVAFGDVRVRLAEGAATRASLGEGWVALLDEETEDLADWRAAGDAEWELDDGVLVGTGATGHLFSPRGDYRDVEIAARIRISDGGNSGLYFRAAFGESWPEGYEAQINSSYPDPQKTGSLYALDPLAVQLVAPDTWFDYRIACRDEPGGTRIRIAVNGLTVTDFLDTERRHESGHLAIQQHHEGSRIEIADLRVREL